jgi:hypothetical protein
MWTVALAKVSQKTNIIREQIWNIKLEMLFTNQKFVLMTDKPNFLEKFFASCYPVLWVSETLANINVSYGAR